jgi:hypothetical protein
MHRTMQRTLLMSLGLALILCACHSYGGRDGDGALSREEALELAVELANERCRDDFGHEPFDASSYAIEFVGDRWRWGRLDPPGAGGFCAHVSFNARGELREVETCFNSDTMPPEESPADPERE